MCKTSRGGFCAKTKSLEVQTKEGRVFSEGHASASSCSPPPPGHCVRDHFLNQRGLCRWEENDRETPFTALQ